MQKVGFSGLGNVGGKLAHSLIRNGYDLIVCDLNHDVAIPLLKAGAKWSKSTKELTQISDIVITCLPSPAASAEVMESEDGVLAGLTANKIWVENEYYGCN